MTLYSRFNPFAWRLAKDNRHYLAVVCGGLLLLMLLLVILGPLLSPYDGITPHWNQLSTSPSLADGHLFGTDALGRDLFVRVMRAGQVSLAVGIAATLISVLIGVTWGAVAGYMGGRVDALMMRAVDILYAMPFLFFVILLMVFFGRQIWLLFLAIGAVIWLDMARIVRGQTLALNQREFIAAARLAGLGPLAIIRRHILPNLAGLVVVYATLTVPQAILVESFLSFLGLGVQPPATSWGALVNEAVAQLEAAPWLLLFPGGLLAITLFCFNFLGDGLRDWLDPEQENPEQSSPEQSHQGQSV